MIEGVLRVLSFLAAGAAVVELVRGTGQAVAWTALSLGLTCTADVRRWKGGV